MRCFLPYLFDSMYLCTFLFAVIRPLLQIVEVQACHKTLLLLMHIMLCECSANRACISLHLLANPFCPCICVFGFLFRIHSHVAKARIDF